MLLLKILIGIVIYIAIGCGVICVFVRYDEDLDPSCEETQDLIAFVLAWPLILIGYGCYGAVGRYRNLLKKLHDEKMKEIDDKEEDEDDEF